MTTGAPEDPAANIADLVTAAALRGPAHAALIDADSGQSLSWSEVHAAVDAMAAALIEAGIAQDDRVAIRLPTSPAYCIAVFAVLRAGAVVVPLNVDVPPRVVATLLADCGAVALIGDAVPGLDLRRFDAPGRPDQDPPELESIGGGEDLAVLCYTSGTSGTARAVMLSHRALLTNARQCAALRPAPVTAADRLLLALPLAHAYGLGPGLIQVAAAGATAVLLPHFSIEKAVEVIEAHRVTTLVGVPPMYSALLTLPEERLRSALSTVRLLTSGAAPLPAEVLTAIRHATGLSVFEGYGLTETGPVLTSTLVGGQAKAGSVGRPLPGVELRLVDSDGDALPGPDDTDLFGDERGGTGVVSVRGPNLFSGYWPDAAHGPDAEGWFRTGDIGYLDADGDLHLVDRANDLIIVNGFNVYPHEVEQVLAELPSVAEAAAVGVPDERTGEAVKAVLVARPDAELTAEVVIAHCAERLARFKVPSRVEFVPSLPHSATGKVARSLLH
ncbi:MAG TPA: AMP-binding protein [Pseudonocardiaceae bacterium]|jgi:long-chain acyl-CoA synthetase|nr:AMP-binding protein [Pseudonocardiaceae bacterium]